MACYAIEKVKLHRHISKNKDNLFVKHAGFRLADGVTVDLAEVDVSITIDGKIYAFPAGSFTKKGNGMRYSYKTGASVKPQIQASFDFVKSEWNLKLLHINADFVDNTDGVDISLSIGDHKATENVYLESKNKHDSMLMFKRKPKTGCALPPVAGHHPAIDRAAGKAHANKHGKSAEGNKKIGKVKKI
jgi:hypothetical protein